MGADERNDSFDTWLPVGAVTFTAILATYAIATSVQSGYGFVQRTVLPSPFGIYIAAGVGLLVGIAGGFAFIYITSHIEDVALLVVPAETGTGESQRGLTPGLEETLAGLFAGGVFFGILAVALVVLVIQEPELMLLGAMFGGLVGVLTPFPKLFAQRVGLVLVGVLGSFSAVNGVTVVSLRISSFISQFWFDPPVISAVYVGAIGFGFVVYTAVTPSMSVDR